MSLIIPFLQLSVYLSLFVYLSVHVMSLTISFPDTSRQHVHVHFLHRVEIEVLGCHMYIAACGSTNYVHSSAMRVQLALAMA